MNVKIQTEAFQTPLLCFDKNFPFKLFLNNSTNVSKNKFFFYFSTNSFIESINLYSEE